MANYLTVGFMIMFVVAIVLGAGMSGPLMPDNDIENKVQDKYDKNIDQKPDNVWNLILNRAVSLDTVLGSIALGSVAFAMTGAGTYIIAMSLLGLVISYRMVLIHASSGPFSRASTASSRECGPLWTFSISHPSA